MCFGGEHFGGKLQPPAVDVAVNCFGGRTDDISDGRANYREWRRSPTGPPRRHRVPCTASGRRDPRDLWGDRIGCNLGWIGVLVGPSVLASAPGGAIGTNGLILLA